MKYLIWLVVLLAVVVWFQRAKKSMLAGSDRAADGNPAAGEPEPGMPRPKPSRFRRRGDSNVETMVQCAHCGIHFPSSEAVVHASGAHYCCEEHRRLASLLTMDAAFPDAGAWIIDGDGWCDHARREPSPNCDERPEGVAAELLVIHNISLPPGEFGGPYIADLFCNRLDFDAHPYFDQLRPLRVSAHFLIRRDGEVVQFVPAHRRAWHAGVSSFEGRERCNDFSIGIELEGTDFEPFTEPQYATLAKLSQALVTRYGLTAVAGHEHIAPVRKTDPGPFFDWAGYHNKMVKIVNAAQLRFPLGLHKSQA